MNIYIFGNPDLENDSLPVRLIPKLQKELGDISINHIDPNEEIDTDEPFIVIDTVVGIKETTLFESLKDFTPPPNFTCHDFDVFANLKLLEKLGRLPKYRIIGVPPIMDEKVALKEIVTMVQSNIL